MTDPMDSLIRRAAGREPPEPGIADRLRVLTEHGLSDHEARQVLADEGHDVPMSGSLDGGARRTLLPPPISVDDLLRAEHNERRERRDDLADLRTRPNH